MKRYFALRIFSLPTVRKLGWEFLFLADNIDAALTADSIGIKRERAVNYSVKKNTKGMFEEVGKVLCCLRCDEPIDFESIEENIKKRSKK